MLDHYFEDLCMQGLIVPSLCKRQSLHCYYSKDKLHFLKSYLLCIILIEGLHLFFLFPKALMVVLKKNLNTIV